MQPLYSSNPHTPRTGTPYSPNSAHNLPSYPQSTQTSARRDMHSIAQDPFSPHTGYGTSQPMMNGAARAACRPQLIAPASTGDRGDPVQHSTPLTPVVGSKGRRGILPSAPGRPVAPVAGTLAAMNMVIPPKDADGKFSCPYCTKTYLRAKHLKRHYLRREFCPLNTLSRPMRRHANPIAQTLATVRTSVFFAATLFLAVIFSSGISKTAPTDAVIPLEFRTCPATSPCSLAPLAWNA